MDYALMTRMNVARSIFRLQKRAVSYGAAHCTKRYEIEKCYLFDKLPRHFLEDKNKESTDSMSIASYPYTSDGDIIPEWTSECKPPFKEYDRNRFEDFPLPFEDKSRLKLKLPFMDEPFYGILDSEPDCFGDWYHFLWEENIWKLPEDGRDYGDCMALSEIELDYSGYSILDWLERA